MRAIPILLTALLLTGCSGGGQWQTKEIRGVLPELEFRLTGENGEVITEDELRGRPVAVYLGYTHCPDICPQTLGILRLAIGRLPEEEQDRMQVLFISVDPERDEPQQLAAYTDYFGPQFVGATADEETLRKLAKRFRATFSYGDPDAQGEYDVSHPSAVYVFDGRGESRLLMRKEDPAEAMAHDFGKLIDETG